MGKNMIFICALAAILDFCQLICFPPQVCQALSWSTYRNQISIF